MPTTTTDGFLAAILADPADDAARLVFADWLEEHDDPRAELIRVQCELAALPAWDRRAVPLRWRAAYLLDRHGVAWRAGLPRLDGVRWGEFRRGFVAGVRVRDFHTLLKHAACIWESAPVEEVEVQTAAGVDFRKLPALPGLRRLRISHRETLLGDDLAAFADCPLLSTLHTLDLTGQGLENSGVELLASSPHLADLRELILDHNYAGNGGLEALAGSPVLHNLTRLSVAGVGYGYADDPVVGADGVGCLCDSLLFRNLKSLNLSGNEIDGDAVDALLESPNLPALEELTLAGNNLGPAALAGFREIDSPLRLQALSLLGNRVGHRGAQSLAKSPALRGLKVLNLTAGNVGDRGLKALGKSALMQSLCELYLGNNQLSAEGVAGLTYGGTPANLHTLSLRDNVIGTEGGKLLVESGFANGLLSLDVHRNNLQHPVCAAIAAARLDNLLELKFSLAGGGNYAEEAYLELLQSLPRLVALELKHSANFDDKALALLRLTRADTLPRLQSLNLSGCRVTSQGLAHLADAAPFAGLTSLNLSITRIDAGGLAALLRSPPGRSLARLHLNQTPLGDAGATALAASPVLARLTHLGLQHCQIQTDGLKALLASPHTEHLRQIAYFGNRTTSGSLWQQLQQKFGEIATNAYDEDGFDHADPVQYEYAGDEEDIPF